MVSSRDCGGLFVCLFFRASSVTVITYINRCREMCVHLCAFVCICVHPCASVYLYVLCELQQDKKTENTA